MTGTVHLGLVSRLSGSLLRIEAHTRRLASGYRIDRAGDDPAGLAVSERLRARSVAMSRAERNVQDAIGALHVADGALDEVGALLVRMRELAVQSANGALGSVERTSLDREFAASRDEIDRIARSTSYGAVHLLDGSLQPITQDALPARATASVAQTQALAKKEKLTFEAFGAFAGLTGLQRQIDFHVGDSRQDVVNAINSDAVIGARVRASVDAAGRLVLEAIDPQASFRFSTNRVAAPDTTGLGNVVVQADPLPASKSGGLAVQLGIQGASSELVYIAISSLRTAELGLEGLGIASVGGARAAMTAVDAAQNTVARQRSGLGAWINRLSFAVDNLHVAQEAGAEALSRIRDVDVAFEVSALVKERMIYEGAAGMLRTWAGSERQILSLFEASGNGGVRRPGSRPESH